MTVLQLAPLCRKLRQQVENQELSLEQSFEMLSDVSFLILSKTRWLLPNPRDETDKEENETDVENPTSSGSQKESHKPLMEPEELELAVSFLGKRVKESGKKFARGCAVSYDKVVQTDIVGIDVAELCDIMRALEQRSRSRERTMVLSRRNFISHLKWFWKEIRRLAAEKVVLRFSSFWGKSRRETVLSFLVLLELIKRRRLFAHQLESLGEILFSPKREALPGKYAGEDG